MAKFFNSNDLSFIKTISEEVVDYVVEQTITLFKMSVGETKTNLYGESLGKVYHEPANLRCIVDRDPKDPVYEEFGPDGAQNVTFAFNRERLRTHEIPKFRDVNGNEIEGGSIENTTYGYPQIGDIISFDGQFYEINNVLEHKLVGGSPKIYDTKNQTFEDARMELIAVAHLVRNSQVQIKDRVV